MDYPKGSEWRRWDLQVQTILDDGYVGLKTYYEELKKNDAARWHQFATKVGGEPNALLFDSKTPLADGTKDKKTWCVDYARAFFGFLEVFNPELACVGLTDHNYFDDQLLDVLVEYSKRATCKAIPGLEINCNGVHMLVFFGQKPYGKPSYSEGIKAFLATLKIHVPKNKSGVLTPTTCSIKEIIDEVRKQDGIIVYPHANSSNGIFQIDDKSIVAEAFNSSKVNLLQMPNRSGFAGLESYIKSNQHLTSKYCLHTSSDARCLKDIGKADSDGNWLWVKANPTFNGLKQIIYEPEQRVFIGSIRPEQKKPYFIIDKVRFIDNTTDIRFGNEPIEISANLTTIIGGKSTGKSLLLHYIAKTINKAEVEGRIASTGLGISYDLDKDSDFNFEVIWRDGQSTFLKSNPAAGVAESKERKILFVPQKYLNTLSEKNTEGREALNQFILNVILQDADIQTKHEEALRGIGLLLQALPTKIAELFAELDEIRKTEEELKKAGDEKGIGTYIQTLQEEIDSIKADSGLTDAELKQYESLTVKEEEIVASLSNLDDDKKTVRNLQSQLLSKLGDVNQVADEHKDYFNDLAIKKILDAELRVLGTFESSITTAIGKVLAAVESQEGKLRAELTEIKAKVAPYLTKVQAQSNLKEKTEALQKEQQKLAGIATKKNAVKAKHAAFKKRSESLLEAYTQVAGKYEGLKNEIKTFESKFGDIKLAVHVAFREESFNSEVVEEYLNKRDLKKVVAEKDWSEDSKYKYDSQRHLANVSAIFEGILSGSIKTVKSRSSKDALSKLLEDHFFLDFRVFYKNDSLDKMSPGKKGLVLLRLLINLSNEEWPILLDQPEDDLDNRSVYEDLVRFIKERKGQRQLIIVTHNPNLVVGADAEEVIVANQSGQEVGRDNKKFRFEYVSDAIEDAFELDEKREPAVLFRKGIRQHVCEILEGGPEAFQKREQKYNFIAS